MIARNKYFLSVLSGLLLWLSWPPFNNAWLLFIAFIPLLYSLENIFLNNNKSILASFYYCFISFITWNVLTTWWIWNASPGGAVLANIANSLFMCVPFLLFQKTRKILGTWLGFLSLIFYWLAFEYLHLHWDLDWPWLTLGNGFANHPQWIQWYEYTGHLGGSVWVLVVNILMFLMIFKYLIPFYLIHKDKPNYRLKISIAYANSLFGILLLVISPITLSKNIFDNYEEEKKPVEIVVVQPNIDPYTEKFEGMTEDDQINTLISLSEKKITPQTDYVIWPETALPYGIWKNNIYTSLAYQKFKMFLLKYPNVELITGLSFYEYFDDESQITDVSRKLPNDKGWYNSYNSAMQIDYEGKIQLYHKSKLVMGVEKIPYPEIFGFLKSLAINLGGSSGSLGRQEHRSVFVSNKEAQIAPIICYESIFGEFVTGYINKGANLLCIITNDGWWRNTPGYKQHLEYASLRAIETRRSIARSANTGISCFINQRGEILTETEWWQDAVISAKLNLNNEKTFYTLHGDWIGMCASCLSITLLLFTFIRNKFF